jgi:4-carboxymuconolactone decarboxylase
LSIALRESRSASLSAGWPLELKHRSLVVVSVLAAIGQNKELKTHLRGALNLGWTLDELREALLQISGYAGFPAAHEALRVLSEIVTQR